MSEYVWAVLVGYDYEREEVLSVNRTKEGARAFMMSWLDEQDACGGQWTCGDSGNVWRDSDGECVYIGRLRVDS